MLEAGLREDSGQGWGGGWGAAQACGQCWPRLDNTFCTYSSSAHPQFCLLHFLLIITHWSKRKLAYSQVEVQSGHVFNAFGVKQLKKKENTKFLIWNLKKSQIELRFSEVDKNCNAEVGRERRSFWEKRAS